MSPRWAASDLQWDAGVRSAHRSTTDIELVSYPDSMPDRDHNASHALTSSAPMRTGTLRAVYFLLGVSVWLPCVIYGITLLSYPTRGMAIATSVRVVSYARVMYLRGHCSRNGELDYNQIQRVTSHSDVHLRLYNYPSDPCNLPELYIFPSPIRITSHGYRGSPIDRARLPRGRCCCPCVCLWSPRHSSMHVRPIRRWVSH